MHQSAFTGTDTQAAALRLRDTLRASFIAFALALVITGTAQGTPLLTIGPDDPLALFPVPRTLTTISMSGVPSPIATLPDGSIGYNGGLAYKASGDSLYLIGNDASFASTLYRANLDGSGLSAVLSLGFGFNGGLTYRATDDALYAVGSDALGLSSLYRIGLSGGSPVLSAIGDLGLGFMGGLAYVDDDDKLYAMSFDFATGAQRLLNAVDIDGTVNALFALGDGSLSFNGGLAYDTTSDTFFAIANDVFASSTLTSFTLSGLGTVAAVGPGLGSGYLNAGLTLVPDNIVTPPGVPEPRTVTLSTLALLMLGLARLSRRRRNTF